MTVTIRPLDPQADRGLVDAFWPAVADYTRLERGDVPPPAELSEEYFTAAPPGVDPATGLRLGLFERAELTGLAEVSFGFPAPEDAYLGLMLLAAPVRGRGLGPRLLAEVEAQAFARGAPRLYLAVLDVNPRGRAFWQREGFQLHEAGRSVDLGALTQTASRLVKPLGPAARPAG